MKRFSPPWFLRRRSRGFTLVEVLSALLIFSVAIVALIRSLGDSTAMQSSMIDRARAADLAENILEEIKYTGEIEIGSEEGEFEGGDATFSWKTEITETETPGLVQVAATVSWKEGEYVLTTLMKEPQEEF